jgi:ribosomal protein L32
MAVPKKRTSKMKKRQRFAVWQAKIKSSAQNALLKAKMLLSQRSKYVYEIKDDESVEENET